MTVLSDSFFPDTIAIRSRTAVSIDGDFSFGAAVTHAARVEVRREVVRGFGGEQVEASHVVYTKTPVLLHDIIFLNTADATDVTKGLEPLSYWETKRIDGGEVLYKTWLTFFK